MVDRSEEARQRQVGIGVGASDPVLDAPALRLAGRHPERDRAVLVPPGSAQRHEEVGPEAAERVRVGRQEGHGFRQRLHGAAQGVAQQRADAVLTAVLARGEGIVAVLVEQAAVQVQAAAGLLHVGLGHEGCLISVLARAALHGALEQGAVVGGPDRVVAVMQIDLELPGRVLGGDRAGFNALQRAGLAHVVEEGVEGIEFVHAVDLGRVIALPGQRRNRRLWRPLGGTLPVDQIELQLEGDDWLQLQLRKAGEHLLQQVARLEAIGRSLESLEGQQHLGQRPRRPGHGCQGAGNRLGDLVGIAVGEAEALRVHGLAVGGEQKRFGSGVFRMKPDGSALEFMHQFNNNTWGLGFNSSGDVFGSTANNNPSFFCGIPATAYRDGKKGMSAKMIATDRSFHPITPNIRQVDAFNNYTAGAGHALATSAAFPESYREKMAFIGGPTGHLLGMYEMIPTGAGYKAKNAFAFVASADEWFSPVAAEVGPDGHLWVADWYNFIIQHNPTPSKGRGGYDAKRGKGNAHVNPNRDRGHGRIYRVIWEDAPKSKIKSLAGASDKQLVAALDSDNLFWRHTAQRLLVDGAKKEAIPGLKKQVTAGGIGAIQALWSLKGIGALDPETHQAALMSKDPALRRNAINALGNDASALQLFFDTAVVQDEELIVRLAAFNKMVQFKDQKTIVRAAKELIKDFSNASEPWLSQSLRNAGAGPVQRGPFKLGKELLVNGSFEKLSGDFAAGWTGRSFRGAAQHKLANVARTGKHSIEISADKASEWGVTMNVPVDMNSEYELSAWVKTENVGGGGRGALLYVSAHPNAPGSNGVKGTQDWTQIKLRFNTGSQKVASINCLFGGWGVSTGKAWWDDVSLRKVEYETITGDESEVTKGDVESGRKIFKTHPIANCARCHAVNGEGGPVGPALDTIATRKQEDYILESLVDPGATIAEGFQGQVSPMPPMGVLLTQQELADVMAYLMTLK